MINQQTGFSKTLQVLFSALFMGQLLATIVFYVFLSKPSQEENNANLTTVFPLIAMGLIVTGYFFFNSRRKIWLAEIDLDARKGLYRSASLVKWAMFEATTLLGLVGYFIFGENTFFYIALASLAHFIIHFPSGERLKRDLQTDDID